MNTRNRKKEYTPFNKNLKKFREASGVSIGDFADSLGLSRNTYIAYENQNREPSYAVLMKIADALHVSIDDLIGREIGDYEILLSKCQQMGFLVLPDNTTKDAPSVNILYFYEDGREEAFHFAKDEFIEIMKVIPNTQEYAQVYLEAFKEWENQKANKFMEMLLKDKKTQALLKEKAPQLWEYLHNLEKMTHDIEPVSIHHTIFKSKPEPPNSEGHTDPDL